MCREHYDADARRRLMANVQIGEVEDGCWEWVGTLAKGYGVMHYIDTSGRKHQSAYRAAHELFTGPIPEGSAVDHTCRNKACVNPAHLEAVSMHENTRRAWAAMPPNPPKEWVGRGNTRRGYGTGSRRERRPGVWQVRYGGRSVTVKGGARDAERALAGLVEEAGGRAAAGPRTLDELLTAWLAAARIADSTRVSYDAALAHLPERIRRRKLHELGIVDFDRLYAELERDGVGVPTIRKLHTALSAALSEAVRWGWLRQHPARGARLPTLPERKVKVPPAEALERLLAAADADGIQTVVWLRLALAVGARRGEVLALRWSHVDLEAGTLMIAGSLNEDRTTKATKTGRERPVVLDPTTVAELRRWRAAQIERAMAVGGRVVDDAWVLSNDVLSAVPWRPDGATQRFRRLCERAGVEGVRLHDLRHAHASMLLRAGVDVSTVSARLGHARASTTLDVYGHVLDGADREAAETIGRLLGG